MVACSCGMLLAMLRAAGLVRMDENSCLFVVEQIQKKKSGNPILSHEG